VRLSVSWIKYLKKRRGKTILSQALRMFRFHAIPFRILLQNMFDAMEPCQAKFTFPIVASVAAKNPALTREILIRGHEIAVHGFKHLNYSYLTKQQQDYDIKKALATFKTMDIPVCGFRAPYNTYGENTPELVEKHGFLWDIGIGYNPKYREDTSPFRVKIGSHDSSFICIPLNRWSDDLMIDIQSLNSKQIAETLKIALKGASENGGVVMFDLHPIRIGQPKYVNALKNVVKYGTELNGWFPTVTEAVNYWSKHSSWKDDASFCCLLTGDIDNFSFFDYLQRLFS
jgi:peptidoglycan/xylan/chitin deacetylase (PgdA/CDA1 family)